MKDTARPPSAAATSSPVAAAGDLGGTAPSSTAQQERHEAAYNGKRRSHSRSPSPRYSPDHNKSSKRYKRDYSYSDYSRSPSPRSPTYRVRGRDSAEEGEVKDPREIDRRDRGRDRGDRHRRRSQSSRSRSRERWRDRDRSSKDRKRSRRDRDRYDDRGYGRRGRDRSRDRDRRYRDRSYERKRSRSREDRRRGDRRDDRGARGGRDRDKGYADYRQRERDYDEQERKKSHEKGYDEYRKIEGKGGGRRHEDHLPGSGGDSIGQSQQLPPYPEQQQRPVPMTNVYQSNYPPSMYTGQLPQQFPIRPPPLPSPWQTMPVKPPPPPRPRPTSLQSAGFNDSTWPSNIAAAGSLPPSPDVSKYIEAITAAHGVEVKPTDGLGNSKALIEKIDTAELSFRRKESHIWAAQQAKQERLLAALDGDVPNPFDLVIEKLGPPPSPQVPPVSPSETKKTLHALSAIPLEPSNPAAPPPDPRSQFLDEYKAVEEWARRPLRLPALRINKGRSLSGGDRGAGAANGAIPKPTTSWSQSPSRDYGEPEVTTVKNKPKPAPPQPPGGFALGRHRPGSAAGVGVGGSARGGSFDDVLNVPSAPKHDISFSRSLPRSAQRTASHHNLLTAAGRDGTPATAAMPPMGIDEGFFMITPPDAETRQGQYSQLLSLVSQGKVPAGWPVYREVDQLWVPLQHSTTSVEEFGSTRVKEFVVGVFDQASVVWNCAERQGKSKEWLDAQNIEAVKTATEVGRGESVFKTERYLRYLVAGEEERHVSKKEQFKEEKEEKEKEFDDMTKKLLAQPHVEADASAERSISEATEKRKLKRKAATLPVSTYAAPAHVVAAVHGALLTNRESIRQVAKSVLQSALRTVIEQQQAEAKKALAEKNADKANAK